jgi:hypothetical protein
MTGIHPWTQYTEQQRLHQSGDPDYLTQTAQVYGERGSAARRIASVSTGSGEALLIAGDAVDIRVLDPSTDGVTVYGIGHDAAVNALRQASPKTAQDKALNVHAGVYLDSSPALGDFQVFPIRLTTDGFARVQVENATIEKTNNAAAGTAGLLVGAKYEASPTALDDGDFGLLLLTAGRLLKTDTTGDVAHDAADSGNPLKVGGVAVSGSASPTSVAAGDRTRFIANQHGIPYVVGGHPNLITREYDFGTSAQTDVNLAAAAVAADERVYITRLEVMCDTANTVNVAARVGFGASNVPTASSTGVSGMIASHPGIMPGSGIICGGAGGVIAVGGAGEEPRITTSAATSGNTHVIISYFLIDETP